jgi:hypothetical protein
MGNVDLLVGVSVEDIVLGGKDVEGVCKLRVAFKAVIPAGGFHFVQFDGLSGGR